MPLAGPRPATRSKKPQPKKQALMSNETGYSSCEAESNVEDSQGGHETRADQLIATLFRDMKQPHSHAPSTSFLNSKTKAYANSRDKIQAISRQGAESLEGALGRMKAAKAQDARVQQRKTEFLRSCIQNGELKLDDLYHEVDQVLRPCRTSAIQAACDNVIDNPSERRALFKGCVKNAHHEVGSQLEQLHILTDADSLTKHYKALLQ